MLIGQGHIKVILEHKIKGGLKHPLPIKLVVATQPKDASDFALRLVTTPVMDQPRKAWAHAGGILAVAVEAPALPRGLLTDAAVGAKWHAVLQVALNFPLIDAAARMGLFK